METLLPWMAWAHPAYNEVDAAEWVRRASRAFSDGQEFQFVMREVATGALLGSVGLNGIDRLNQWANLGYWIRTSQQGRGFVTRATRLVSDFGLTELNLGRIEILAAVDNHRSQAVATRAGALREGVLRRRLRVGEVVQDAVVFSIV
jgi:RimJ/RimL family protein N-acetyltransferase